MKNIFFAFLFFAFCFSVNAQPDSVKLKQLGDSLSNLKKQVDTTQNAVKKLSDTLAAEVKDQLIVDASALDSAQKFPEKVLYKTYLFNKNYKAGIRWFFAILAFAVLLFIWITGISYSITKGLCKDPAFDENGKPLKAEQSPFSYARVQLLFWTLIILTCYTFFFGITGELIPLNVTAVLLLGFGAMVYGMGKVIDSKQINESKGFRNQDVGAKKTPPDFLIDILSDDNGVSVHRFQAVVFNLVFGIGFIGFFVKSLFLHAYPLPDFNEWQFSLLGISSATYLGLKAAENSPATTDKNASTNASPENAGEQEQDNRDITKF